MKPKSAVSDGTVGWATFSFPPLPSPLCVSSAATVRVAQTASLLYRRMPSCRTAPWPGRLISTSAPPISNRRYGRLTICATLNRSSPLGRGRIVRRLWAISATEFAKPVCAPHAPCGGCSLPMNLAPTNSPLTPARRGTGQPGLLPSWEGLGVGSAAKCAHNIRGSLSPRGNERPEGTSENSPAFQRWVGRQKVASPEGTAEVQSHIPSFGRPFGTWVPCAMFPGVKTPGYSHVPPGQRNLDAAFCAKKTTRFASPFCCLSCGQDSNSRKKSGGFTLIEIMVVVIVIGILAATIIPQFMGTTHDAKVSSAKANIAELESALERFNVHMDRYPTADEGLKALVETPANDDKRWRGPYVKQLRLDPRGSPYESRAPGLHHRSSFDLWSRRAGKPDGGEGQGADIGNW